MAAQLVIEAAPESTFPADEIIMHRYEGDLRGVRFEGTVDKVIQNANGAIAIQDLVKDSGFWFMRQNAIWFFADGDLEIHIMYVGVVRILGAQYI